MIRTATEVETVRCAIYTRKSHEEGLEQEFNSLDAQREAAEAFIASQRHEGWMAIPTDYSDGGFSGGNIERPGLKALMRDIEAGRVDCVMVYKVDRLSRSLMDFARLMSTFDERGVSFVSVTQQFNTTTSMGRLTLNILLSFAQFEREIIGERIRDKKAASAKKGKYIGGNPFLGYDLDREKMRLLVNADEAEVVRLVFERFIELKSAIKVARELNAKGLRTKAWKTKAGRPKGNKRWNKVYVYRTVTNRKYIGEIVYKGQTYPGEQEAIVDRKTWDRAQRVIAENSHARTMKTRRTTPALLRDIIRCGHCGNVMGITSPGGEKSNYRYYLCHHARRNGYDTCPVKSVAAGEIETAVVEQLRRILRSPDVIARTFRAVKQRADEQRAVLVQEKKALDKELARLRKAVRSLVQAGDDGLLADELRKVNDDYAEAQARLRTIDMKIEACGGDLPGEAEVADALGKLDPVCDELYPGEQQRVVQLLVKEVRVSTDGLLIRLRTNGLRSLVAELDDGQKRPADAGGDTIDIQVPMEFKVRGGRKEIILPPDAHTTPDVGPQRPLVVALARAYRWQELLDTGEAGSIAELARKYDVDRSYVSRILNLTALAPDIVEAILAGNEPSGLSLAMLRMTVPFRWDEQGPVLGFRLREQAHGDRD